MKTRLFATTAGAMALAFAMWNTPGLLQGQPMDDRINVNLPYTITVGDKTLPPGDYVIQRLPNNGGSRVLLFYSDSGMKYETVALPFAALDMNTARETKLILNRVGDDYYIHKIWVQGKDYGYELPMPRSLKARWNEMMAKRKTVSTETVQVAANSTSETSQDLTANREQETDKTEIEKTEVETAQNTEQPVAEPIAEPSTLTANADNSADRAVDNSADRAASDEQTPADTAPATMPKTASEWVAMMLIGSALSGASLMLRRKQ